MEGREQQRRGSAALRRGQEGIEMRLHSAGRDGGRLYGTDRLEFV